MGQRVNINGEILEAKDAKISVFDRGFLFGDSVYETIRTYRAKIFLADRHLRRLQNSASMLRLDLPLSLAQIEKELNRTVEAAGNPESYVRLIVTRGEGKIGLDIQLSKRSTYVILVNPLEELPAEYFERGVPVAIVSTRRNDRSSLSPLMKSSNLLNNILAYSEAKEEGAFEGILCNLNGYITEGTGSNLFVVHENRLITPPLEAGLLEGVTRGLVMELARNERIECEERNITPVQLLECQECFITSTTKAILPVSKINHTELQKAPGPITRKLMAAYDHFVGI